MLPSPTSLPPIPARRRHARWCAALWALVALAAGPRPAVAALEIDGFLTLRGGTYQGQKSWLRGGFGRLADGGATADEQVTSAAAEARLGLDWEPSAAWLLRLHVVGRTEPHPATGRAVGIVEAFAQRTWTVGVGGELALRVGQFFLPTSLENRGPLWTSDMTLTLSALNSWIAEEMRPIGLDFRGSLPAGASGRLTLAATPFGGNDSAGALLAWRGWSLGGRTSVLGELLPLPPLDSLAPEGAFAAQRDDGSLPFGRDLDGRVGWAVRGRWIATADDGAMQAAWLDNRGDRGLHRGEYAWRTRFGWFGGRVDLGRGLQLIGEVGWGDTGMGHPPRGFVQADLQAGYLMASWAPGPVRFALRFDRFSIVDRDGSAGEDNDERGRAWTLSALWRIGERWRLGGELLRVEAERPAAAESGFDPDTDGRSALLELRFAF